MKMKERTRPLLSLFLLLQIAQLPSSSWSATSSLDSFSARDGKVLELDESNFDQAIASFDYILVDFYAPWCGHCKRLAPQLDAAAPVLAELKDPVVIAKVDVDKYKSLATKHDIDGFPTLKLFTHGVPMEYYGPRKPDLLVRFLKKFVAPDVAILDSDSAVSEFVEDAGAHFPIYIGFGVDESAILNLARKYKKKAWFSVAKDFSENLMAVYDFNKIPSLVAIHPKFSERNVFYGPFEDKFLDEFVKQNFLPLAVPINYETLKLLQDDNRKIILGFVEDEAEEKSKKLVKLLKAAASANRDLVFGYIGVKQFEEFADSFGINKKTALPRMIVWDGNEEYTTVIDSEVIDGEDQASQITKFIEGYREGRTEEKRIKGPSLMSYIDTHIGLKTVYFIGFFVVVMIIAIVLSFCDESEPTRVARRGEADSLNDTSSEPDASEYKPGDKEE